MDLFRELLRVYSFADIKTYYEPEDGTWDDELMLTDIEVISAHRDEAGAPERPPLEQVPAPPLPTVDLPPGPGTTEPVALRKGQITGQEAALKAQAREHKRQEDA